MERFNKNLKFGWKVSVLISILVFFLWLGFIRTDLFVFNNAIIILSILHTILIFTVFYFLKKNKIDSSVSKKYKLNLSIVTILSFTIVIADMFLNKEHALSLGFMLLNSILVCSYPIKRYTVHE